MELCDSGDAVRSGAWATAGPSGIVRAPGRTLPPDTPRLLESSPLCSRLPLVARAGLMLEYRLTFLFFTMGLIAFHVSALLFAWLEFSW